MLLTLALFAQSADLPGDTAEAARLCAAASLNARSAPIERSSQTGYFTLLASREARGAKPMLEQIPVEAAAILARMGSVVPTTLDACRKRFPLAWAPRVTLPADPFDRKLGCIMASGFLVGLLEPIGDAELTRRYTAVNDRFGTLLADSEFAKRGLTTSDQFTALGNEWLARLVDLGNPLAIVTTCEAAFPA